VGAGDAVSGTCACCGHSKNGHQHGAVCTLCEDTLNAIKNLPGQRRLHVLIRAAGATAAEIMQTLGCAYSTNSSALNSAKQTVGCDSIDYLILVARYGLATKRLPLPEGFDRPVHMTPVHEAPAPRIQPRPEIPEPPEMPVVIEHREPAPIKKEEEQVVQIAVHGDMAPEQARKIAERLNAVVAAPPEGEVIMRAIEGMLPARRTEAELAAMAYQDAFAGLAHLALTGETLPDFNLVRAAYNLGLAKGAVETLEALA
jgi:hypothetical protein